MKYLMLGLIVVVGLMAWRLDHMTNERDNLSGELSRSHAIAKAMAEQAAWLQIKLTARDSVDNQYQEAIERAQTETARIRDGIERGDYRVYVRASCPVSAAGDTSTASGTDAAPAELDSTARQSYLDFRAGYEQQRQQLIWLQEYVSTVCLK